MTLLHVLFALEAIPEYLIPHPRKDSACMKRPLSLCVAVLLLSHFPILSQQAQPAPDAPKKSLLEFLNTKIPWKDGNGVTRSPEDLEKIIEQHKLWLSSDKKAGAKANFFKADLRGERLNDVDLREANFTFADLSGAHLDGTDLRGAVLILTRLNGAFVIQTELQDADVVAADVEGTYFEPHSLPDPSSMARVQNLYDITYDANPQPLYELGTKFQKSGFFTQSGLVMGALKKTEVLQERALASAKWQACAPQWMLTAAQQQGRKQTGATCRERFWEFPLIHAELGYVLSTVMFDWTCQYGTNAIRPLLLIFWFWLAFAVVYFFWLRLSPRPVLCRVYPQGTDDNAAAAHNESVTYEGSGNKRGLRGFLDRQGKLVRAALGFSLFTTFNLSFKELDFGRWLHLLSRTEFSYKPIGWLRVVAGFQSLFTFYLLVVAVLSYFGEQFK